jgi:hypothetical protein
MQHYLSSREFNDVPITHLFIEYKHWIDTKHPFNSVTAELEALANAREQYKKFVGGTVNSPTGAFGRFLEVFDVGTIYPLLLVLAEANLNDTDMAEVLAMLESYILRRTVCGLPTKAYNRVFLNLASAITKDSVSVESLRTRLSALTGDTAVWPSDEEFHNAFINRAGYLTLPQSRVLYILKRLNETFYSNRTEAVTIHAGLTVEHVMPQKWQEHWLLPDGTRGLTSHERWSVDPSTSGYAESAERDRLVQGMGNLTLLTQPLNSSSSNSAWQTKRTAMADHSILPLNQKIANHQEWNEQTISNWAEELYQRALKIWRGPASVTNSP